MNAIKEVRKYLEKNPGTESARILAQLTATLVEEGELPLASLYQLEYDAFNLALELFKDWRLDRYYAARIRLFDVVLEHFPDVVDGPTPPAAH